MKRYVALSGLTLLFCAFAPAQESAGQRVVVPARNTSRPRLVKATAVQSPITVRTHTGNDVIVETTAPARPRRERERDAAPAGMRRIDLPGGFSVEEEDNVINVRGGPMLNGGLIITVPVDTSVQVKTANGPVTVDGVHGEVDASSANGRLELVNISGTIVAETANGPIRATMDRVDPSKPISFSSNNGSVEVTLPADLKANIKMRSFQGSVWSDFEMKLSGGQPVTSSGGGNAKFQVKFDRTMAGTINGGGVEANFTTLNGRIVIRKK